MTVFEFALYRYAVRVMPPAVLAEARRLAALADRGNRAAAQQLREMVMEAIRVGEKSATMGAK